METPDVSTLKTEIAVLEGIIWEKKEQLRIAEAIEKQKDDLWRKHVVGSVTRLFTCEKPARRLCDAIYGRAGSHLQLLKIISSSYE